MYSKILTIGAVIVVNGNAFCQTSSDVRVVPGTGINKIFQGFPTSLEIYTVANANEYITEINNGRIEKNKLSMTYIPDSPGKATVFVNRVSPNGDTLLVSEYRMVIQPPPKPTVYLNRQVGGTIPRKIIAAQDGFTSQVAVPGADIDARQTWGIQCKAINT